MVRFAIYLWAGILCGSAAFAAEDPAISRDFPRNTAEFLCVPDCVAERVGFELSVQAVIVFSVYFRARNCCARRKLGSSGRQREQISTTLV
jgi:hypothetical protein